jgi:hypothetical protein
VSYSLVPYAVDLNQLRAALGSKDEALLTAILESDPERFEEDEDEGELSLRAALRHLVMGLNRRNDSGYQYGYALEHLCAYLGERLDSDEWESIRWEVLEETGMVEIMEGNGSPVRLSRINDFPSLGHLTPEQVRVMAERIEQGPLTTAALSGKKPQRSASTAVLGWVLSRITSRRRSRMTDQERRELLAEYEDWIKTAAANGKGLVFFYY